MKLRTAQDSLKSGLCIGCGLCKYLDSSIEMTERNGLMMPNRIPTNKAINDICPSIGYDLVKEANIIFGEKRKLFEIGTYRNIYLAHSNSKELLDNASSGGIMTSIACYMLEKGIVDGVICNKFEIINNHVRTATFIAHDKNDLLMSQGSKYAPTTTLSILGKIKLTPQNRYLLIGTPCQIAGFRLASKFDKQLSSQIVLCIANFCGGYRDFREIDFFVRKIAGFQTVSFFRHRGGGQPGSMLIINDEEKYFNYPYPEYAKLSPFVKNERCTLCMDATGELADISCGDAWLDKTKSSSYPWSIVISRSEKGEIFLQEMESANFITINNEIASDEVVKSQRYNIKSKKYRQYKRIRVRDLLLLKSPNWYDHFDVKDGSYLEELRIMLSKLKARRKEPKI